MSVSIATRSRLQFMELLTDNDVEFWELDVLPDVPLQPDDLYIQLTDQDRIDSLASKYYNDPNLWWVIATANSFELVPTALVPNRTIRIPSPTYVLGRMFSNNRPRPDSI